MPSKKKAISPYLHTSTTSSYLTFVASAAVHPSNLLYELTTFLSGNKPIGSPQIP